MEIIKFIAFNIDLFFISVFSFIVIIILTASKKKK
jgi:hypothetical protein